MAHSILHLRNTMFGHKEKTAPVGFSWTTLLFGCFVPLLRADWKNLFFMAVTLVFAFLFTGGIAWIIAAIIWATIYNKMYVKQLLLDGYRAYSVKPCLFQTKTLNEIQNELEVNLNIIE